MEDGVERSYKLEVVDDVKKSVSQTQQSECTFELTMITTVYIKPSQISGRQNLSTEGGKVNP